MIREAQAADAKPISVVLLRAWQSAYRGIAPDAVLEAQRLAHFLPYWEASLPSQDPIHTWVAEREERVAGFAHIGPCRDDDRDPSATIELYGMYVDPDHIGTGVGRELMETVMAHFTTGGWREATLWMLDGNLRAQSFYESFGWEAEGTTKEVPSVAEESLTHVRFRIGLSGDPA